MAQVSDQSPLGMALRDPVIGKDVELAVPSRSLLELSQRAVVVTGASGMLASYILASIEHVRRSVGERRAKSIAVSSKTWLPPAQAPRALIEWIPSETAPQCIAGLSKPLVVHAASPASPAAFMADPLGCMEVNTTMTSALARATGRAGGTFIYLSSSEIYGASARSPVREGDYAPLDPTDARNVYAEAKRAGEAIAVAAGRLGLVDTRVARLFHTFGPGVRLDDERIFGAVAKAAALGEPIRMRSDGRASRTFLYSWDALEGLAHLALLAEAGAVVNLAGEVKSISSICQAAAKKLGVPVSLGVKSELNHQSGVLPELTAQRSEADSSLIRRTGWRPSVGVEEGLARMIRSTQWRHSVLLGGGVSASDASS